MTKKTIDTGVKAITIGLTLVIALFLGLGTYKMSTSKENSVTHYQEVKRDGYESAPAYYKVDASMSKAWEDGNHPLLTILGFIIGVGGTFIYLNAVHKNWNTGSFIIIGILWAGSALLIFTKPLRLWGSSSYTTNISEQRYEEVKGKLDILFPSIDK